MSKSQPPSAWVTTLSALSWSHPFWATLIYEQLSVVFDHPGVPTLAVGGGKLYVNTGYFGDPKFNSNHRIFMVAHEVSHEMYFHPDLMKQYAASGVDGEPFDARRYNIAADYVINAGLIHFRIGEYHHDWLQHDQFTWEMNVLDVYRRLKPPTPPPPPPGGGKGDEDEDGEKSDDDAAGDGGVSPEDTDGEEQPGQGGCSQYDILDTNGNVVGQTPEGQGPQDDHRFDDESPHDANDWKEAVAGAQQQAKSMGTEGSVDFNRMIDEYLTPDKDWKREFQEYVTVRRGRSNTDRRRVHKRKMHERGIPFPIKQSHELGKLLLIHDVSGSVSMEEHKLCKGTSLDIFSQCRPTEVRVMSVASQIMSDDTFTTIEEYADWNPTGSGCTDMEAGFRRCIKEDWIPVLAVVLTDGYTPFSEPPPFPVVWLSTALEEGGYPYGRAIKIEAES